MVLCNRKYVVAGVRYKRRGFGEIEKVFIEG